MGKLCSVFVSLDFLFIFIEIACTVNLIFITCFYGLHFFFFLLTFIRKIQLQKWVHQILGIFFFIILLFNVLCLLQDEFFGVRTCFLNLFYRFESIGNSLSLITSVMFCFNCLLQFLSSSFHSGFMIFCKSNTEVSKRIINVLS